jgi:hypothetical protein
MNITEELNRDKRQILEGRLSSAQSRLHKDAIRTAYLALAEHDLRTGRDMKIITTSNNNNNNNNTNNDKVIDIVKDNAFTNVNSSLFRAMDYSTSKIQTAQIGLLILESALNAGNFISVRDYAERTESTLKSLLSTNKAVNTNNNNNNNVIDNNNNNNNNNTADEAIIRDIGVKVQIAKGIERMVAKDYRGAANAFFPLVMKGSGDSDYSNNNNNNNTHMLQWRGVTSPEDVALYAGLMCLVTRDRSKMITLADDPEALELVPAVKELLIYYSRAKYEPCMRAISGIHDSDTSTSTTSLSQPLLPLGVVVDVYLTPTRWNALIQTIRENCVVEYLRPYQRVKLESLKDLFFPTSSDDNNDNNNLDSVIDTMVDLMDRKLLPSTTRLDCREKILFQKQPLQNPTLQINSMEERIMDDSHAMLVRLACLEHDLVYHDPNSAVTNISGGGGGSGGRRGGNKGGMRGSRRHRQQQHRGTGRFDGSSALVPGGAAMADSSSDDGDDDDDGAAYFEDMDAFDEPGGGGDHDTHMVDVDASAAAQRAMNPQQDMY